jgi:hypothetical protein
MTTKGNVEEWVKARGENARLDDSSGHTHAVEAIHPHELVTGLHSPTIR